MNHVMPIETRSAEPIALRSEGEPDLSTAIAAIGEVRTAVDENRTALDTRLTTEIRGLTERLDGVELRIGRPGGTPAGTATEQQAAEQRAFYGFMRRGRESLPADEVRMLRVADDTAGGFLAPEQFVVELLRNLVQISPLRAAARVSSMSATSLKIPKRTGTMTAKWVGEIELRPPTQPAYGEVEMAANEMSCYVDVSNQLLEDSVFDIAAELSFDFAEEFGRLEGQAFVIGDGVKKPLGILADPTVPTVSSGLAATINGDSLVSIVYSLPAFYRQNASWLLSNTSIAAVAKLKDAGGNYLWRASLDAGQPPTLLGFPVLEAVDMPDIAAGTTPIMFGDFGNAYRIYDRVGLAVLRNPYTLDIYGQTRFTARRRVAAGIVKPEALRKLIISAS